MTQLGRQTESSDAEGRRADEENVAWLGRRGVRLFGDESGEALVTLREAIEQFELVVEQHGGDLMVDEPVRTGQSPQKPDNELFALPTRGDDESLDAYTERVEVATDAASQGPWQ
jgi:hypothetical protein